jgi:hypothetical protein
MIKSMEEMGIGFWKNPAAWSRLLQNFLLIVDIIKTIPVFCKLEMADQVIKNKKS